MTSSELSLRLARPAEATTIANLSRDLIEYGLQWRWTPMRVASSMRAADVNVLVACNHDNMAGFAIMRYGDDDAHLDLLAVAPPYRRAGIGRQLLEWLENAPSWRVYSTLPWKCARRTKEPSSSISAWAIATLEQLPGYYQGIEAAIRMGRDLSRRPLDHRICCPGSRSNHGHSETPGKKLGSSVRRYRH